jgi:hypothetical protein
MAAQTSTRHQAPSHGVDRRIYIEAARANPRRVMADVWALLLIVAFFALCVAFVRGCEMIIGPDDTEELAPPEPEADAGREPVGVAR